MKKIIIIIFLLICINFNIQAYDNIKKYDYLLISFCEKHDIKIYNLYSWIMIESSGKSSAYNSKSKDKGLVQLNDVDYLVSKYWDKEEDFDVWNGDHNLYVGLKYLDDLIEEFGTYFGFVAYNIGPTRVRNGKILKVGIEYANKIFISTMRKS